MEIDAASYENTERKRILKIIKNCFKSLKPGQSRLEELSLRNFFRYGTELQLLINQNSPIMVKLQKLKIISCELPFDIQQILVSCNQLEEIFVRRCYGSFFHTGNLTTDLIPLSQIRNNNLKKLILTDNVSCRSNLILPVIDSYAPNLTHFAFTELTLPVNIALDRVIKLTQLETFTVDLMGIPVNHLRSIMLQLRLKQLHLIKGSFIEADMSIFRELNELRLDFGFDINLIQIKELLNHSSIQILYLPPNLQLTLDDIIDLIATPHNLSILRIQTKHGVRICDTAINKLIEAKKNDKRLILEVMSDTRALFFDRNKLDNSNLRIYPSCTPQCNRMNRMRNDFLEQLKQFREEKREYGSRI